MGMTGGIGDILKGIIDRASGRDTDNLAERGDIIESKLAKDDRGAWVDHMVDSYLKHEPMETPPIEFNITNDDILKEIMQREIKKIVKG